MPLAFRVAPLALVVCLQLSGCNCGPEPTPDAGPGDAGPADAGVPDAGPGDAGAADAGAPDAGSGDAGTPDAGPADAGAPDAGPQDAGEPDAGPPRDDAGCPLPGGLSFDAADAGLPPGLVLWLRADVGVATLPDGGPVCRWDDVSGNQRHVYPATAVLPRFSPQGLAGGPAVQFTALGHLVRGDVLGLGPTQGRTIAARTQVLDTSHRFHGVLQGQAFSPGKYFGLDQNTFGTAGSREGVFVTNNSFDADLATDGGVHVQVLSVTSLVVGTALPGALTYAVDGVPRTLILRVGNLLVQDFSGTNFFTAVGYGPVANFGTGLLGEVLVFDHALTPTERAAVEAHLAAGLP
jgi:hypothetical protein